MAGEEENTGENTDREIWRKEPGDFYSPYISVSADNEIIICVGGKAYQAPVGVWFELMRRNKEKGNIMKKLLQLHHQSKTDHNDTIMVEQNTVETTDDFNTWFNKVKRRKPPPDGYQWMVCNEKSEHFVMAVDPSEAVIVS